MARYLSNEDVARQADQFLHFHNRTGASFGKWADSKDFQPGDRKAIREHLEGIRPLGWEGVEFVA